MLFVFLDFENQSLAGKRHVITPLFAAKQNLAEQKQYPLPYPYPGGCAPGISMGGYKSYLHMHIACLTFVGREVAQLETVASEAGGDVQREDRARLPQRALLAHAPTPSTALLRWLENQAHRALQARLALLRAQKEGGEQATRCKCVPLPTAES